MAPRAPKRIAEPLRVDEICAALNHVIESDTTKAQTSRARAKLQAGGFHAVIEHLKHAVELAGIALDGPDPEAALIYMLLGVEDARRGLTTAVRQFAPLAKEVRS